MLGLTLAETTRYCCDALGQVPNTQAVQGAGQTWFPFQKEKGPAPRMVKALRSKLRVSQRETLGPSFLTGRRPRCFCVKGYVRGLIRRNSRALSGRADAEYPFDIRSVSALVSLWPHKPFRQST